MEYNYLLINPEEDRLKELLKNKISEIIIPAANELDKILIDKDFPVLKINSLIRKIEDASTQIGIELRAQVNIEFGKIQKQNYQKHIFNQLMELYDEYGDDDGNVDWERIKKEKVKFLKTFPLKDAIAVAKLVQSGELEI